MINCGVIDILSIIVFLPIFYYELILFDLLTFYRYDFDNDGFITKEDCRFLLSYLPLGFV